MCQVERTTSFKKDLKRLSKRELGTIDKVVSQIIKNDVSVKYKKHEMVDTQLSSVHILPDCVMLYRMDSRSDTLILHRIGSHAHVLGNRRWLKTSM